MTEIVKLTLENEMDLILAHKKAMRLAEKLNLTISTQTTFATAVSEVAREVIDKTDSGVLCFGVSKDDVRCSLTAQIKFGKDVDVDARSEGCLNAQRLVPMLEVSTDDKCRTIELSIGIPRSLKIDREKIRLLVYFFHNELPYTPYEEIKLRNKELHEKAEEKDQELRQSKYINEQKNEFISIASHELKTPVTVIKAYAQLALASGKESCSTAIQSYLTKIEHQASKLTALIQQLMDVSKIESGKLDYKMELVNLDKFITDAASHVQHTIPGHALSVKLNTPVKVRLDKLRMEQVLSNIIGNAAKYSPGSSSIELQTSPGESNFVVVSVKDYGIGISNKNMLKIFDKFYRDEQVIKKYSGLGMGLYISSKIIHGHGGSIWVDSKEGEGSTFHFSLPFE